MYGTHVQVWNFIFKLDTVCGEYRSENIYLLKKNFLGDMRFNI